MGNHKKKQEGVFIALFALSTLVVLGLAIGFMSNTVNDLLAGQGQVMAGKQSYWLAYSGMEITSTNRFAGITAGTNTYTLEGGTITATGASVGAGKFNGSAITNKITSTGTVADASRQLKWTLDTPTLQAYDFASATPKLTMNAPVSIAQDAIFTISAWVYIDALSLSPLFGLSANTDNHWIRFTDANNMAIKGTGPAAVVLSHGLSVGTGSWQHIAITRGSLPEDNTVTVYVNGVAGSNPVVWNEQFLPNAIGTDYAGGSRHYFDGRIAQVAIWNTTLPEDQVRSIYIQGLSFDIRTTADDALTNLQTGMVHYWVLNGGVSDSQGGNTLAPSASCTATGI